MSKSPQSHPASTSLPSPPIAHPLPLEMFSFARNSLHEWVSQPQEPQLTLTIYSTPLKSSRIQINIIDTAMAYEVKRLASSFTEIKLPTSANTAEGYGKLRQLEHAEKALYDWALHGPNVMVEICVLADKSDIRTFVSRAKLDAVLPDQPTSRK